MSKRENKSVQTEEEFSAPVPKRLRTSEDPEEGKNCEQI